MNTHNYRPLYTLIEHTLTVLKPFKFHSGMFSISMTPILFKFDDFTFQINFKMSRFGIANFLFCCEQKYVLKEHRSVEEVALILKR